MITRDEAAEYVKRVSDRLDGFPVDLAREWDTVERMFRGEAREVSDV